MEKEILEGSASIAKFMGVFMEVTNKPNEWKKNSTILEVTPIYELPFIFIPTETRHISQTDDFNKIRESALDVSWGRVCQKAKYHTSWDWLMPVCKKLDRLVEDGIIDYSMVYEAHCDNLDDAVTRSYDISEVFPVVVQFIHFYNTQSK